MRASRALTEQERAVVERLLSVEFREVGYFRAQVPAITVIDVCDCGCGSLQFWVDEERAVRAPSAAWDGPPEPIVEGDSTSWLMLFQRDGWLSELEHVAGHGPNPWDVDAGAIEPESQVNDDWFE